MHDRLNNKDTYFIYEFVKLTILIQVAYRYLMEAQYSIDFLLYCRTHIFIMIQSISDKHEKFTYGKSKTVIEF